MSFMRDVDLTRAIGRVGLKVEPVLGPGIARAKASAIWVQNRRGLLSNPIQISQVMEPPRFNTVQGHINYTPYW